MTENELIDFLEDEISGLKDQRDGVIGEIAAEVFLEINGKERISKLRAIIGLITEVKQYRKLGTVEELKNQKHNLSIAYKIISDYQNIGTVEECREAVANRKANKYIKDGFLSQTRYVESEGQKSTIIQEKFFVENDFIKKRFMEVR